MYVADQLCAFNKVNLVQSSECRARSKTPKASPVNFLPLLGLHLDHQNVRQVYSLKTRDS